MQATRTVILFLSRRIPQPRRKKDGQKRAVFEWIGAGWQLPSKPAGPEKIDGEPQP